VGGPGHGESGQGLGVIVCRFFRFQRSDVCNKSV
jgi:hypothetical protein